MNTNPENEELVKELAGLPMHGKREIDNSLTIHRVPGRLELYVPSRISRCIRSYTQIIVVHDIAGE